MTNKRPVIEVLTIKADRGSRSITYRVEVLRKTANEMLVRINGKPAFLSEHNGEYKAVRMNGSKQTTLFRFGLLVKS